MTTEHFYRINTLIAGLYLSWIEGKPPELDAQVRILLGTPEFKKVIKRIFFITFFFVFKNPVSLPRLNDKIAHGQHCHKGIEHAYGEQHVKML